MITIPQPAMAMNSHDVPLPIYRMTNTFYVPSNMSPIGIMSNAAFVFKGFRDKNSEAILTLVINCHGFVMGESGGFGLGIGKGITSPTDVVEFEKIAPYVSRIYLIACQAARITRPGNTWGGDGNLFCGAIAKAAQAEVIASTANQRGFPYIPFGKIDDFEGTVLTYGADGSVIDVEYN